MSASEATVSNVTPALAMQRDNQRDRARDFARMEQALEWLSAHALERPSLEQAARAMAMSPFHFQRLFSRWAGVSPKQFLQALSLACAKRRLAAGASVLEAALEAGLSGPGRLHETLVNVEAVTPGRVQARARRRSNHLRIPPLALRRVPGDDHTSRGVCAGLRARRPARRDTRGPGTALPRRLLREGRRHHGGDGRGHLRHTREAAAARRFACCCAVRASSCRCGARCWSCRRARTQATGTWRHASAVHAPAAPWAARWGPIRSPTSFPATG